MASSKKPTSETLTESAEQLTEESELGELSAKQSAPLSPEERANKAYVLVYGEDAKIPTEHKSIRTAQDADWFIRSYLGRLFATPNDNPLTEKFKNLEELLVGFDQAYPAQVDDAVEPSVQDESAETVLKNLPIVTQV